MQTKSQLLQDFYNAYHNWLENGADIEDVTFSRGTGLCSNLTSYLSDWLDFEIQEDFTTFKKVRLELIQQFHDADLDPQFPFNGGESVCYDFEAQKDLSYLNPKRIQWVKEHL